MNFQRLADTLDSVSETTKRKEKINIVADFLRKIEQSELSSGVLFLSGRIFPESEELVLNVSWNSVISVISRIIDFKSEELEKSYQGDIGEAIAALLESKTRVQQSVLFQESLTIQSVSDSFRKIALVGGKGSSKEKQALLSQLFAVASPREMRYLVALILSDMRTGLAHGLIVESISEAFEVNVELVRRAWNFSGNLGETAHIASLQGEKGLAKVMIRPMVAVKPMLASPINSLEEAFEISERKEVSLELKLDGARVQIHRDGKRIRIFSRGLNDVTDGLPDIVQIINDHVSVKQCILDGEVIAVDEKGKPFPFQVVMKRFGRTRDVELTHKKVKLTLCIFDALEISGKMLVDQPYHRRRESLEKIMPSPLIVERVVTDKLEQATRFFQKSKERGHEGLVIKLLDSPYVPGVRGKYWLKIKHTLNTLDLVIIAAEWGHGRRNKWLSDYHLAVYDEDTNDYVMVGKTFKGLTDEEFQMMTEKLQKIQVSKNRNLVYVKPEVVVEVLAAEIQKSLKYTSGLALRFARITRIRDDKGPEDATTLRDLQGAYKSQFQYKAR